MGDGVLCDGVAVFTSRVSPPNTDRLRAYSESDSEAVVPSKNTLYAACAFDWSLSMVGDVVSVWALSRIKTIIQESS